jgi:RNA recognition motif-containing protein
LGRGAFVAIRLTVRRKKLNFLETRRKTTSCDCMSVRNIELDIDADGWGVKLDYFILAAKQQQTMGKRNANKQGSAESKPKNNEHGVLVSRINAKTTADTIQKAFSICGEIARLSLRE